MSNIQSRLVNKTETIQSLWACKNYSINLLDSSNHFVRYTWILSLIIVSAIFEDTHPIIIKFSFPKFLSVSMQKIGSFHQFIFWIYILYYISDFKVKVETTAPIFDHNHPKTSNNKHDWTHIKYLNVLHDNRTQKQSQKLLETLMFVCMIKMNSIPNFFFEIL